MSWQPKETIPKDRAVLVYGQPEDMADLVFKKPQIHLAYWDSIDERFCLDGGTWVGPFIDPEAWHDLPPTPTTPNARDEG